MMDLRGSLEFSDSSTNRSYYIVTTYRKATTYLKVETDCGIFVTFKLFLRHRLRSRVLAVVREAPKESDGRDTVILVSRVLAVIREASKEAEGRDTVILVSVVSTPRWGYF